MEEESLKSKSFIKKEEIENYLYNDFLCMLVYDFCLSTTIHNVIIHLPWLDGSVVCHDGFPYVEIFLFFYMFKILILHIHRFPSSVLPLDGIIMKVGHVFIWKIPLLWESIVTLIRVAIGYTLSRLVREGFQMEMSMRHGPMLGNLFAYMNLVKGSQD